MEIPQVWQQGWTVFFRAWSHSALVEIVQTAETLGLKAPYSAVFHGKGYPYRFQGNVSFGTQKDAEAFVDLLSKRQDRRD